MRDPGAQPGPRPECHPETSVEALRFGFLVILSGWACCPGFCLLGSVPCLPCCGHRTPSWRKCVLCSDVLITRPRHNIQGPLSLPQMSSPPPSSAIPVSTPSWSLTHTHTLSPEHLTCCSLCLEFVPSMNISQVPPPRQALIRDLTLRSPVCLCGGDVCTLWRQRAWGKMWHGPKEGCEGTGHKVMGLERAMKA